MIVYFDGVCFLCNSLIYFLLKIDKDNKLKFSPLQSHFAERELKNSKINLKEIDSIILQVGSMFFIKSDAVIKIIKELRWYWRFFLVIKIVPKSIRDKLYDFVASNRFKWFGKKDSCMVPTANVKERFILN
jgi:predicted DCC family thiol-disulfide oxidoreductase YuxK